MKPLSRALLVTASLMLLGMYVLPMWSISLDAPQYPEGLGLKIYINTIQGAEEHDLQNINGLNHYIGMKRIEPDAIPELRYMPLIIAGVIALGLLAALLGRCWMALAWSGLFTLIGVIGIVDFYCWEYDYGHNLDPHAAIVIPGMAYQPPLIGSKQLLNFTAHSYPDSAGYIAVASILLGFTAWWLSCRARRSNQPTTATAPHYKSQASGTQSPTASRLNTALLLLLFCTAPLLSSCEPKPENIDWNKEECAHCKMTIADKRFAAQLLTAKGKAYKFDAIECMAAFINNKRVPQEAIHSLWVMDYDHPDTWLNAKKSLFLAGEHFQSPMSLNIAAFASRKAMQAAQQKHGGNELYWDGVRLLTAKEWSARQEQQQSPHHNQQSHP
jgi:copper chaperone NosL